MFSRSLYLYLPLLLSPRAGDDLTYHRIADETLDELTDFFEDLAERGLTHSDFDTSLSVCIYIHSRQS